MKKSRILSLVLIALFVFSLSMAVSAEEINSLSCTVEASASAVETGKEFTVDVVITENTGFRYALLEVSFPADAFSVVKVDVSSGSFASVVDVPSVSYGTERVKIPLGTMLDAMGMSDSEYYGVGKVATITFLVNEEFEGNATISMDTKDNYVRDLEGNSSTFILNNGSSTVSCFNAENHEHTVETLPYKAPTCTEVGLTEGSWCSVCHEYFVEQDEIPALGHTEVIDEAVAPSCTETGLTEGKHCSVCNAVILAQEVVPATGEHVYATEQSRVDATCTTEGYKIMACGCGETQRVVLEIIPHTPVIDAMIDATCTAPGKTEGSHCSVCGNVIVAQNEIPAKGHSEEIIPGYAATCTEPGLTDGKYCAVCDTVTVPQDETPLADHQEELLPGVSATCTEPGKTPGKACAICNTILVAQTDIPASGHSEIFVSAVAPTCSSTGLTEGTKCATCGITISGRETVDKLPHTEGTLAYVAPTCATVGKTEGKYCTVCSEILVPQTDIATTEHTNEIIAAIAPTCSSVGWTEGSKCSVCGEITVVPTEVAKADHTVVDVAPKDATCTEAGYGSGSKCSACGEILATGDEIPALGHSYDNECDSSCNSCGEERTSVEHNFGDWVVSKEATKDATGLKVRTCTSCNKQETEVIPVLSAGFDSTILVVGMAFVVMIACVVAIIVIVRKKK